VLKPIWRECCKETLDIKYRAEQWSQQWLMSTWILTEKLSKNTAQARKIQSGNSKEINDVLVLRTVLPYFEAMIAVSLLFGKMINFTQNTCQDIAET
jgi:hypothetical protein